MPLKKIGSPDPKYLVATDILISDMSNINYDFLIYNRPIILIANEWLRKNFPDLGIKTDLNGLENAIERSIKKPQEFEKQRKYWHKRTMHKPDGNSSSRVIDVILKYSGIKDPFILLIHGNNEVSKVHLDPLYKVLKQRNIRCGYLGAFNEKKYGNMDNLICISTHNQILENIRNSYNVHIDHSVKGAGVTDFERQLDKVKKMDYYPLTHLHITEGEVSHQKTLKLLGPYSDRAVMAGYPKSDTLLELRKIDNKRSVFRELGFNYNNLMITYAPTGKYSYPFKQGASLSPKVIYKLRKISDKYDYNILIKLRSALTLRNKILNKLRN